MKTHSRSNNLVAILIAILLFAIGFVLYFIHEQTQVDKDRAGAQIHGPSTTMSLAESSLTVPGINDV